MRNFSEASTPLYTRQLCAILSIAIIRPRAQIEDGLIKGSTAQMTKQGRAFNPMTFLSTVGDVPYSSSQRRVAMQRRSRGTSFAAGSDQALPQLPHAGLRHAT